MATITKRRTREVRDENGKIIQHARTRYRAEIKLRGFRESKTFHDRKLAERWAREVEDRIQLGTYEQTAQTQRSTVRDLIAQYETSELPQLRSAETVRRHLAWWRGRLGKLPLSQLTPARIIAARDELAKGDRSPSTVNRYTAALSSVCSYGVKRLQLLDANPCQKVEKLKEPAGRTRHLDEQELRRLLDACREISAPLHLAVVLALSTGARRMSVWGLRWRDIDLSEGKESVVFKDTKNRSDVHLPLVGLAVTLLLEHRKVRRLDTDLLFASKKDPTKPMSFRASFERALKQAEIEGFRWHDLRHSAASYLAQSGVDLLMIAQVLGHKTLQMSMRYSHLNVESKRDAMGVLNRKLNGGT